MENYTCEESSVCTRFQSAICLHCNRRLCLVHITEHNKIIVSSITNLSIEVKSTFQQIREGSKERENIFNDILTSVNQWRTQQIEKIEQIYENHLKLIESQRQVLTDAEVKLFKELEQNASQPLEHIQRQQNASMEIINHIQRTIETVREDNSNLKWKLATPSPPNDMEYPSLNPPSISVPIQSSNSGIIYEKINFFTFHV
jgi:hypothetical protein